MLDENTQAIVAMAWARAFELPDDAFTAAGEQRRVIESDSPRIAVLRMLGRTVIAGPAWALHDVRDYTDEVLASTPGLLDLVKNHRPSATNVQQLLYADDYLHVPGLQDAEVTADPRALDELLPRCAPDDVQVASLQRHEHQFVLLEEGERPVAAAAYTTQYGILADLAFLGAIEQRGSGASELAASVAMHDALDAGLIPQLRLDAEDDGATARTLGFDRLGVLATVEVDAADT